MKAGIAGAGLLGRLLALELLQQGWQVTLFDQDSREGNLSCGKTAAGMISPLAELEIADSDLFALGLRSLELWPQILQQLDQPVSFHHRGSLLVAHNQDYNELVRLVTLLEKKIPDNKYIKFLDTAELAKLEPELQLSGTKSVYLSAEAHLCPEQLFTSLESTLLKKNIDWQEKTVVLKILAGEIVTTDKSYHFDQVFDCRGLGAKMDIADLRGVRGELIWLHAPHIHLTRPIRLMHPRYQLYLVPQPNDIYLVGASEIESEDQGPISVRTCLELLTAAYSLHPGFAEARVIKTIVNCRPTFSNHLPSIIQENGVIRINGLYRHGYMLAPALIEKIIGCGIHPAYGLLKERLDSLQPSECSSSL